MADGMTNDRDDARSTDTLLEKQMYSYQSSSPRRRGSTILIATAVNVSILLLSCLLWVQVVFRPSQDANFWYRKTSLYSPVFDKGFPLFLEPEDMDEHLWGLNESTSIYIQDPSPEVDAAWDYIAAEAGPVLTINSEEVRRLGRDPNAIVKAPSDWGFGDDAYPAQIDVFHEIHCLDMLRKVIHWDHYFRPQFGDPSNAPYLHVRHRNHCLRIVLRSLMCNADADIVTHNWHRGTRRPIADFENPRQCRDFRTLLEWSLSQAVPDAMEKWRTIERPTDAVILPRPTPNLYIDESGYDWTHNV